MIVPSGANNVEKQAAPQTVNMPFEDALKKLESIVDAMESQEMPLEDLLRQYQEGTILARMCQEKLSDAEVRIEQLEKDTSGELRLKPFAEPSAEE